MVDRKDFHAGRSGRVEVGGAAFDLSVVPLGELHLPSGRLEASDPFVNLGEGAVVHAVPPGSYPVEVTVADVSDALDGSHVREAYLSVLIRPGEVASVVPIVPEGRPEPEPGSYYGVPVDAGTVAFADAEAVATQMPEGNWYDDLFEPDDGGGWFALMDDPDHLRAGSANIDLPGAGPGNVVLTHSGWGDGFYPVLATRDADGELLGVHLDLLVVVAPGPPAPPTPEPEPTPPRAAPKRGLLGRLLGR